MSRTFPLARVAPLSAHCVSGIPTQPEGRGRERKHFEKGQACPALDAGRDVHHCSVVVSHGDAAPPPRHWVQIYCKRTESIQAKTSKKKSTMGGKIVNRVKGSNVDVSFCSMPFFSDLFLSHKICCFVLSHFMIPLNSPHNPIFSPFFLEPILPRNMLLPKSLFPFISK